MSINHLNASNSFGIFDNIKSIREGWKAEYAARTKGFFSKFWQRFVIHHPQHTAVQLNRPGEGQRDCLGSCALFASEHQQLRP